MASKSRCLGCNHPDPKEEERHDPSRRFCNEQCQKSYYRIGLKDDGKESGLPPIDDDDTVGLQSADGRHFRLKRSDAIKMRTIRDLVEDAGTDAYIPIPNVAGDVLEVIVEYVTRSDEKKYTTDIFKLINSLDANARITILSSTKSIDHFMVSLATAIGYLDVEYMIYLEPILRYISRLDAKVIIANYKPYIAPIIWYVNKDRPKKVALLNNYSRKNVVNALIDFNGSDVMTFAAIIDNVEMMEGIWSVNEHLISLRGDINEAFITAVNYESMKVVQFLLKKIDAMSILLQIVKTLNYRSIEAFLDIFEERKMVIDYNRLSENASAVEYDDDGKLYHDRDDEEMFESNKAAVIEMLLEREPIPIIPKVKPIDDTELLKTAIMRGDIAQLRLFLRDARDVNYDELIAYARDYERDNIVEYLLRERGAKKQRIQRQIK